MLWKRSLLALMASSAYAFNTTDDTTTGSAAADPSTTGEPATVNSNTGGSTTGEPATVNSNTGGSITGEPATVNTNTGGSTATPGNTSNTNAAEATAAPTAAVVGEVVITIALPANYTAAAVNSPSMRTAVGAELTTLYGISFPKMLTVNKIITQARRKLAEGRRLTSSSLKVDFVVKMPYSATAAADAKTAMTTAYGTNKAAFVTSVANAIAAEGSMPSGSLTATVPATVTLTDHSDTAVATSGGFEIMKYTTSSCTGTGISVPGGVIAASGGTCLASGATDYLIVTGCADGGLMTVDRGTAASCSTDDGVKYADTCYSNNGGSDWYTVSCTKTGASTSNAAAASISASLMAAVFFFF